MSEKYLNQAGFHCRVIVNHVKGLPMVFLHGLSFSGDVWRRINITTLLAEKHVPFLALDMPYGMQSECQPRSRSSEKNVAFARETIQEIFGNQSPVLVGASIGGHMALLYASQYPVKGLLLIAPSRVTEPNLVEKYPQFKFPVRIIWGTEDNIISGEDMRVLSEKLPTSKLVTYENAGHSAYLSQPDRFKHDLLELYADAEQHQ